MKILVSDRDGLSSQIIRSKLESAGFVVVEEPDKNMAMEILKKDGADVVLFDPAPIAEAQPVVLGIRRSSPRYPYIIFLTQNVTREDAFRIGCNDILSKPVTGSDVVDKVHNAARLI